MAKSANVNEEVKIDETITTEVVPAEATEQASTVETPAETAVETPPAKEVTKKSSKKSVAAIDEGVDKVDAAKIVKDPIPEQECINVDDPKKYVPLTTQFMM